MRSRLAWSTSDPISSRTGQSNHLFRVQFHFNWLFIWNRMNILKYFRILQATCRPVALALRQLLAQSSNAPLQRLSLVQIPTNDSVARRRRQGLLHKINRPVDHDKFHRESSRRTRFRLVRIRVRLVRAVTSTALHSSRHQQRKSTTANTISTNQRVSSAQVGRSLHTQCRVDSKPASDRHRRRHEHVHDSFPRSHRNTTQ